MIYTKTGDKGETSLANGERISKADARIEAYGTVDELNSWIGMLRASIANSQALTADSHSPIAVSEQLRWLQNKLFNLGAALSLAPGEWIKDADVQQVEQWIDAMQEVVPRLKSFVLPSGSESVARCHVCRTVCRRAERKMIALGEDGETLRFMNRISDYLFVLARYITYVQKETEESWKSE
jgi:cob(I)alamin adenosyltransferase